MRALIGWLAQRVDVERSAGSRPESFRIERLPNAFEIPREALDLRFEFETYLVGLYDELVKVPHGAAFPGQTPGLELPRVYTPLDTTFRLELPGQGPDGGAKGRGGERSTLESLPGDAEARASLLERLRIEAEAGLLEEPEEPGEEGGQDPGGGLGRGPGRPLRAVESLALSPGVVLLGDPGSGKSTLGRWAALCHAGTMLGPERVADVSHLNRMPEEVHVPRPEHQPWPHGPCLPLLLELRHFVRQEAFPANERSAGVEALASYFEEGTLDGRLRMTRKEADRLRERLRDGEQVGRILVIFDGLDEVEAEDGSREGRKQVRGIVRQMVEKTREAGCRVVVTARPYAYGEDSPWRLPEEAFPAFTLAPYTLAGVRSQIQAWFEELVRVRPDDDGESETCRAALERSVEAVVERGDRDLLDLLTNPLHLRMVLGLAERGTFPDERAQLLEGSIRLAIDDWNRARGAPGPAREATASLGIELDELRTSLELLAFQEQARGRHTKFRRGAFSDALEDTVGERSFSPRVVRRQLRERSGILVPLATDPKERYQFPTASHQEYLAGCHSSRRPEELRERLRESPELWREVFRHAAGSLLVGGEVDEPSDRSGREARERALWEFLAEVVPPADPLPEAQDGDHAALLAHLAARVLRDHGLLRRSTGRGVDFLPRLRRLLELTVDEGLLELRERLASALALARFPGGDTRPGVGVLGGVPNIRWVHLPAVDAFPLGTPEDDEDFVESERPPSELPPVKAFKISRYLVTVAQFQAFADDGGYNLEKWGKYWTKSGEKWLEKGGITGPVELPDGRRAGNLPRTWVSWYEAHAFCKWLDEKLSPGRKVKLPTEIEWERAARGPEGRKYPWVGEWEEGICNSTEAGLRSPSPVGMFLASGTPPEGPDGPVHDLAGNVSEWCQTKYRKDHNEEPDDEDDDEESAARVLRGGSYLNSRRGVRAAARYRNAPRDRRWDIGFRVVSPSSS